MVGEEVVDLVCAGRSVLHAHTCTCAALCEARPSGSSQVHVWLRGSQPYGGYVYGGDEDDAAVLRQAG